MLFSLIRRHTALPITVGFSVLLLAAACGVPSVPPDQNGATDESKPVTGGELTFVVSAEPPSFDGHKETTFAMLHPTAPHYSLLLKFDPDRYPAIIGDAAESWSVSPDGLAYSMKLRDNVRFRDGAQLTSTDVKATYEKILGRTPPGATARKASYGSVDQIETPNASTIVFRMKQPTAAALANFASPWNYLYKAEALAQDPRWYEKNVGGTGPFTMTGYVGGSHWTGNRNPAYYDPARPYLDSFRAVFIRDVSAQVAAVRSGRAHAEFRGFTPPQRDDLVRAAGKNLVVQESPWTCALYVAVNTERAPWNDVRARRALSLALDRWEGSAALSQIAFLKEVGGLMRPGAPYSMTDSELTKIAGFGRDGAAAKEQARRLLREAGVPEGYSFSLLNRDVQMPYEPLAIYLIDQWSKVGLKATQAIRESGPYLSDLNNGNYEIAVDYNCDFMDEPDLQLIKFISKEKSTINYARYSDPVLDDLYAKQAAETNPERRKHLVNQFEHRVLDEMAYQFPTLWWQRIIPHSAQMKGWKITPSHYLNQDLATVWLAPQ